MNLIKKIKENTFKITISTSLLLGSLFSLFAIPVGVEASVHVQDAQIVRGFNFRTAPSLESNI
jgi:hypothetical protein